MSITERLGGAFERTRAGRWLSDSLVRAIRRAEPAHWTGLFGVVTMACVVVLFVTGVVLMFFYQPSSELVAYEGGYGPLHGVEVSRAFASMLTLSLDVPGGLLVRQAHHWAALLLPASIIVQLAAAFFTGAFRRPRQGMWVLLFLILVASLAAGWSGYALPDDMLAGTGARIVEGIVLGIPVVGTWAAALLFGGGFPGRIVENLYPVHLLVPVAMVVLMALRARAGSRLRPLRMPGPARRRRIAEPARSIALFGVVCGVLTLMGATVTVAPIWLYGPSDPGNASAGSQPDWYTGFLDGALRLVPPGWELEIGGYTLTLAVLVPLAVVGAFLLAVLLYPFLENWITRDRPGSDLLDRPRAVPTRTAIGVAGMSFYGVLWGAASADVVAVAFRVSLGDVIVAFQVALLVAPAISFVVTRRICLGLQRKDRDLLLHGRETGRIVRMPGGAYVEQHVPIGAAEREVILAPGYRPLELRPTPSGRILIRERVRVEASRLLFRDRVPVDPEAIEAPREVEREALIGGR